MHAEHANSRRLDDLSRLVIGCAFAVLNSLGCGFAEKIYENALVLELQAAGLTAEPQFIMPVIYRDTIVGQYVADILVEGMLLIGNCQNFCVRDVDGLGSQ
jgi:GxxExxY protein